jgi:hypothetical protein
MYECDPSIEYIDIADELRLVEAIEAMARDLEEIRPIARADR